MAAPLEGLRVLDLTRNVAGPYATKLLADYGADVLKLEPPGGDPARRFGPFPGNVEDREASGLFLHLNTNKRSATVDPSTAEGATTIRRLAAECDIVIEDYDAGRASAWGWGWDELSGDREDLVMLSLTPFGQDGPYRDYLASEITLQALGGPLLLTGHRSRETAEVRRSCGALLGRSGGRARHPACPLPRRGGRPGRLHRPRGVRVPGRVPRPARGRPDRRGLRGLPDATPVWRPASGERRPACDGRLHQPVRVRRPAAGLPRADRARGSDHPGRAVPTGPLRARRARRGARGVLRGVPAAHTEARGAAPGAGARHPRRSTAHGRGAAAGSARPGVATPGTRSITRGPDRSSTPAGRSS